MGKNLRGDAGNERSGTQNSGGINEDTIRKYQGKSESELMNELMRGINNSKKNGTFDPDSLEAFYNNIKDKLSPEQRKKMRSIIDMIKRQG